MAYQTGTASSYSNLISILQTFAGSNGWSTSGDVIYKGSVYAAIVDEHPDAVSDGLSLQGGTGQSGGSLTGASTYKSMLRTHSNVGDLSNSFPVTYYMFVHTSPDQLTCVINYNGTWYQWLTVGELAKYATYTGGQFYATPSPFLDYANDKNVGMTAEEAGTEGEAPSCVAPFWGGYNNYPDDTHDGSILYMAVDSQTWWTSSRETNFDNNRVNTPSFMSPLIERCISTATGNASFLPYYVFSQRPSDKTSLIGDIAHFRITRVDNYTPGQIVTIGSDKYKVFPFLRKTTETEPENNSGVYGMAIEYDGP